MAEHAWTILCHKNLIDPDTNVLSLIDIVEQLILQPVEEGESVEETLKRVKEQGKKGVFFPVQLRLVTYWARTDWDKPEECRIRFSLVDPAGEKLLEQLFGVELVKFGAQRIVLRIDQLHITGLGYYWFLVERELAGQWDSVSRIPIEIVARELKLSALDSTAP